MKFILVAILILSQTAVASHYSCYRDKFELYVLNDSTLTITLRTGQSYPYREWTEKTYELNRLSSIEQAKREAPIYICDELTVTRNFLIFNDRIAFKLGKSWSSK